jgi:hypothetical protein
MKYSQNSDYIKTWNSIVKMLVENPYSLDRDIYLESYRHAAHVGLLHNRNVVKCQAVLDCTDEYERTGKIPGGK